jgi:CRP/FNR family transcriptional regulator, cyclic AMP receptor protein
MGAAAAVKSGVVPMAGQIPGGNPSNMGSLLLSPGVTEVRVLEADPDLGARLSPERASTATERLCARVESIDPGPWDPRLISDTGLGLLVLDGLICRGVSIADRSSAELLGAGDLLRPWQDADGGVLPCQVHWRVLERVRLAILDQRFSAAIAPWPEVSAELVDRAIRRSRWQSVFATISHMTRVDVRLLLAFWHFADRWGRVTSEGVVIRLPLTHEAIGTLIGARRPSVTTGLRALANRGLLKPLVRGEWLLTGGASALLDALWADSEAAVAA